MVEKWRTPFNMFLVTYNGSLLLSTFNELLQIENFLPGTHSTDK